MSRDGGCPGHLSFEELSRSGFCVRAARLDTTPLVSIERDQSNYDGMLPMKNVRKRQYYCFIGINFQLIILTNEK